MKITIKYVAPWLAAATIPSHGDRGRWPQSGARPTLETGLTARPICGSLGAAKPRPPGLHRGGFFVCGAVAQTPVPREREGPIAKRWDGEGLYPPEARRHERSKRVKQRELLKRVKQ